MKQLSDGVQVRPDVLTGKHHKVPQEETAPMFFKENLKAKIKLDGLLQKVVSTMREGRLILRKIN